MPSRFSCPECQGVLWEINDAMIRFRCRVGHAYSSEALLAEQSDAVETAIWAGLRTLEENAALVARMAKRFRAGGSTRSVARFEDQASSAIQRAEVLRRVLLAREPLTAAEAIRAEPASEGTVASDVPDRSPDREK